MESAKGSHHLKNQHQIMEDQIRNARLSFTCNQEWEKMKPDQDGRFCESCQKKVYDLSDKNAAYFIQIMRENNNSVCGRFRAEQINMPVRSNIVGWRGWLMAMLAAIGITACKEAPKPASVILGGAKPRVVDSDPGFKTYAGMAMPTGYISPECKQRLQQYLFEHCVFEDSVDGHFGISFSLRNNKLTNLSFTGKLSKLSKIMLVDSIKKGLALIRDDLKGEFPYQINVIVKKGRVDLVQSF